MDHLTFDEVDLLDFSEVELEELDDVVGGACVAI